MLYLIPWYTPGLPGTPRATKGSPTCECGEGRGCPVSHELPNLAGYRLERAQSTLDDARLLLDRGKFNSGVNRIYYACFYAVLALLQTRVYPPVSMQGYFPCFLKNLSKTGVVPKRVQVLPQAI